MWLRKPGPPRRLRAVLLALGMIWIPSAGAAASGVVVAAVAPGSAAERAGLLPGDLLLGWERPPDHGRFATLWDVGIAEIEQAPRGGLTLFGERAGRAFLVQPPPGDWELTIRPDPADLSQIEGWSLVQRADAQLATQEANGLAEARQLYLQALAHSAHQFPAAQVQLWERLGRTDLALRDYSQAQEDSRKALSLLGARTEGSLLEALLWHRLGRAALWLGEQAEADDAFHRSLEIRRRLAPGSLAEAAIQGEIGSSALAQGDLQRAEEPMRRALEIRRRLDPDGLATIRSLNALGAFAVQRSRIEEARQLLDEALARVERRAPGTALHSQVLNNRAMLAEDEGDLAAAAAFLGRTLEIGQKLAPGSNMMAATLNNLGLLAQSRGDYATAEAFHEKALAIWETTCGSSCRATSLTNLGLLAALQGDDERARERMEQALTIYRQMGTAEGMLVVPPLSVLGELAARRGELPAAEDFFRRALVIVEREAPDSNQAAETLVHLGRVARQRGDFAAAQRLLRRALERSASIGPRSIRVAEALRKLADLAVAQGSWADAEDLYQQALALSQQLTPGTLQEASDLRGLGRVKAHTGRKAEAAPLLLQALDALEAQVEITGATREVRTAFRAASASFYADAVDILLDLGQVEAAFHTVERSRARGLLELLAERDLELSQDLSPELVAQRRQLAREDDRLQNALSQLQVDKDAAEIERWLAERKAVAERRARLAEEIRRASPRRAAFTHPRVLGWPEVRASLDPGTALLSYLVEERRTLLFAGIVADPPRPLAVFSIPLGDQALRGKVARLQKLVARRQRSAADGAARELYDALLAPAASLLADARRLLILPDGPLHVLPFAALIRGTSHGQQYLVEWKPFSTAASATVHAELLRTRPQGSSPAAVFAFGDPQYRRSDDAGEESPALRSSLRRGLSLHPLPASRQEARAIARIFTGESHLYLGPEATEEKAKSLSKARYLHFACHGLYDKVNPLDSALALALPAAFREDRDNGLLQAWEIFEQVHLEADLVTLSACQSGLGQEVAGEGLIGLTRAFHYAGARSVVASLWEVADRSTADLMQRFYAALRQGISKDEALRQAQLALIRRSLPPFHWAAFQLSGDWR